jgi:hypothetical protein
VLPTHQVYRGSKAEVTISGLREALLRVLTDWRPPSLKTELEYRDALFKRLREVLPEDARVEKEYRHGGTTADLYLRWKGIMGGTTEVFFELKRNLRKKVEFDRLIGQVEGLDPRHLNVVIVLAGEVDAGLVARLKERYADFLAPGLFQDTWMALVEVP